MLAILHNIRSSHNVGSIFRTADAIGVEKLYLCGITPDPVDRFGTLRTDITKASLGAEKTIHWEHIGKGISPLATIALIKKLKKNGFIIAALEQNKGSKNLFDHNLPKKKGVVLIVGNEVNGIPLSILKHCDVILEIPMSGKKESLNVSVAFGIAGYHLRQ
ncbi:MAG: TrmH family RNA methyltransferase [Patescibacteria group bacterium]|nr:TrmH family RNA methyltransferase [Patescibacteria group bacterium]